MPFVADHGVVSYNGFVFPPYVVTDSFSVQPQQDSTRRTITASRFEVGFRATIAGLPTDAVVQDAIARLSKPGMPLVISGRGIPVAINVGRVRDVQWGPMPLGIEVKPLGHGNACQITWRVAFVIPVCADARFSGIMEAAWSAEYQQNRGYTTRTVAGKIRIAQNRIRPGVGQLIDSPDYYLESVIPPLVPGYYRTFAPRKINEAKDELQFGYTDQEIEGPNFPPEWVVDVDASESYRSTQPGLKAWGGTISARYELSANAPDKWIPLKHFLGVHVRDRIQAQAQAVGKKSRAIVPLSLEISNPSVYKARESHFSFTWSFITDLAELFQAVDAWRPIPGSNWQRWAARLSQTVFGPRGYAEMVLEARDDAIIDLCGPVDNRLAANRPDVPMPPTSPGGSGWVFPAPQVDDNILTTKPAPDKSWVTYTSELFCEWDSGAVQPILLPTLPPSVGGDLAGPFGKILGSLFDALRPGPSLPSIPGLLDGTKNVIVNDVINPVMRRVKPPVFVYLRGRAARYGHKVLIPRLTQVNGVAVVDACRLDRGEGFSQGTAFSAGSSPIYVASWNLRYRWPTHAVPTELPVPPNPLLDESR